MFAPMPRLEGLMAVLSLAAIGIGGSVVRDKRPESQTRTQATVIDIARAYFCAKTDPR